MLKSGKRNGHHRVIGIEIAKNGMAKSGVSMKNRYRRQRNGALHQRRINGENARNGNNNVA